MEFKEIVMKRYATKLFDKRKVEKSKVDELLELVRHAPSSFNIQPWKIIVVEDQKVKEKLAPAAWNQPQIESCSHLLVFCANSDILGNIERLGEEKLKNGIDETSVKASMEMMKGFEKQLTDEQRLSWAQRQTYLALGNAVNGAKSLGFDSCPMEGFNPLEFAKILEQPENIVPTALCTIGYAADKPTPKIRFKDISWV